MRKRKLQDNTTTTTTVVNLSYDSSPISEVCGDQISEHRSCWRHVAASLCACKKNITQQDAEEMLRFERTSPCLLGGFSTHKRSRRKNKYKNDAFNLDKKLSSSKFEEYLEKIWKSFSEDKRASFTLFDSMWFFLYLQASTRENVLTWIKRNDIFSKKYVLVPIVCWGHWSLLIFCHFGESLQSKIRKPCMLLLDSLQMADPRRFEPHIRKFVLDIYRTEGRPENKKMISRIPLFVPKVPQQRNGEACGYFVLYFINLFVDGAPENFSISEGYPYSMEQNWFSHKDLEAFCKQFCQ